MAYNIGCTGYSDICGYHEGIYYCDDFAWDSVTRSGNTVTVKNFRIKGNCYWQGTVIPECAGCGYCTYAWGQGWRFRVAAWKYSSDTYGSDWIARTDAVDISMGDKVRWYDNPHIIMSNASLGDISFTVGANDTSYSIKVGSVHYKNTNENIRDYTDSCAIITFTFPAGTKTIHAKATNATFDINKNGTVVGEDVSDYSATWDYNTKYDISDIKATGRYYLTYQSTDLSGNLTTDKDWTVAEALLQYIGFNVTGTNVTFDVKIDGVTKANDVEAYGESNVKQQLKYSISDVKRKNGNYILDSKNEASGTTGSSDISINAGVASPISFTSSIGKITPLEVNAACEITIDDKSGRTRNWNFVAKLKKGSTTLATITKTTGTAKTAEVKFDRNAVGKALLTDVNYTVEWEISDKTDKYNQIFLASANFKLPCLGYVVTPTAKRKISYYTVSELSHDEAMVPTLKYGFKRATKRKDA